ncbi:hypothetical protein [Clostridioides difficile]
MALCVSTLKTAYIFSDYPLPLPIACSVLPSRGIVVEVSPIRSLPADCPF